MLYKKVKLFFFVPPDYAIRMDGRSLITLRQDKNKKKENALLHVLKRVLNRVETKSNSGYFLRRSHFLDNLT